MKISMGRQTYCPGVMETASGGRGSRRSSLTSVVLQEHNSGVDNGRGGVGRGWLADWCTGLGISSDTR